MRGSYVLRVWWGWMLAMVLAAGCARPARQTILPVPTFDGPGVRETTGLSAAPARQVVEPATVRPSAAAPTGWVPPGRAHRWRYIVIHHSATKHGNAAIFDRAHRERGWDELGYHFVIGNGLDSADGQVEVGSRWIKQKRGAHAGVALYNQYGIGICVVGNFEQDHPTANQQAALVRLLAHLMTRHSIPSDRIVAHRRFRKTACPGRHMNVSAIAQQAAARAAGAQNP